MSVLNVIKHIPNRFTRLIDSTGQMVIVYNRNGDLIVPNCHILSEVEFIEETAQCYNDFPVRFNIQNKSVIGFLTEDNVIQEYSKLVDCDVANKSIYYPVLNMRLTKKGSRTSKKYETNRKTKLNYKQKNFAKLNFHHSSLVVNGVDTISEFLKLTQINEKNEVLVVEENQNSKASDYPITIEHKRSNWFNYIFKTILIVCGTAIGIISLIVLLIFFRPLLTSLRSCKLNWFKRTTPAAVAYNNQNQTVMIEMQPINEPNLNNQVSTLNTEVVELITRLNRD